MISAVVLQAGQIDALTAAGATSIFKEKISCCSA